MLRLDPAELEALAGRGDPVEFGESLARVIRRMPADVAAVVSFFEVPTGDSFDVPPEEALAFFKSKGLIPSFSYADVLRTEHDRAFTIAKMMDVDMLGGVRASLDKAMADGTSFEEWKKSITPQLQAAGWWGRKSVKDPLTGRILEAQLGSPWRLETIFRTNMQSSYAAAQWAEIQEQADVAPFLMYDAIDDLRTRPLHGSWDRKVLPVTSAWWKTHYPPNGYNCRCGVIQLDGEQVKALGLEPAKRAPDDGVYLWKNPRTGYSVEVPNGIDPGFDKNVGLSGAQAAAKLLAEKVDALPAADMKAAARMAKQAAAASKAATDAIGDADSVASIAARATLARMQAVAVERSKQLQAMTQLDAIKKGKESAGVGAAYKIKALAQLKQSPEWLEAKPADQLAELESLALVFKKKVEDASKLSIYKKAILEGKTPAAGPTKVFNALPDAEKAAFVAKIDEELQALAAAQAKALADAEAAAKAANLANVAPATFEGKAPNPLSMTQVGAQKGSNPGGEYVDTDTGARWYVKQPVSEDIARNEVLAAKLYELAGMDVPELHIIKLDGKVSIASRMFDGLEKATASKLAGASGTAEGFAVDAWLANWDVVGLGFDNLLLRGARVLRVDTGGALRYRAQGGLKGNAWGSTVTEIDSLRSPTPNRQAFEVFGKLTPAQIEDSVVRVLKIDPGGIEATVVRHGPLDKREAEALIDTLKARQRDLAKRYPEAAKRAGFEQAAAEAPPAPVARVTQAEQQLVEQSRANGYGFSTDGDAIEDHQVIVHTFGTVEGGSGTRASFKVLEKASRDIEARIVQNLGEGPAPVDTSKARQLILDAVKSINARADKAQPLDQKVFSRIGAAIDEVERTVGALFEASTKATNPKALDDAIAVLSEWSSLLSKIAPDASAGLKAVKFAKNFPASSIPDSITYGVKSAPTATGPKWRKVSRDLEFNEARFEKGAAIEGKSKASLYGARVHYVLDLPDGGTVQFVPADSRNAFAVRGLVRVNLPGKGEAQTSAVFDAIDVMGIPSTRATALERQTLYLNAYARLALVRRAGDYAEFNAIKGGSEEAVKARLALLKKKTGVDVEASEGWKSIDGVRQAFGHGRAYQHRPDLKPADVEDLNRTHAVFHNPKGLGRDAGSGSFERIKTIIDAGGSFSSIVDRARRGLAPQGTSWSSDLESGGGDYHFTSIVKRGGTSTGSGVYWRAHVLRRMDAISYSGDRFGRVTPGEMEANRQGETVASLRSMAGSSGNETIFKGGLSVFDDVDRIVLASKAEVDDAIKWMRSRGYERWPDGRDLGAVIITKAKHHAET